MAGNKRGPARKPHLQAVKEGDKRAKARPDPILLPPGTPPEPRWTELQPAADGFFPKASATRIRRRAQHLWKLWVSILDPQGVLAIIDEITLQDAALCAARLEEAERMIWTSGTTAEPIPPRIFGYVAHLRQSWYRYIPQLGLSPASRLEAREGGRLDSDFDDI
jgi:hypothetical protein